MPMINSAKPQILVFPNKLDNELFETNTCDEDITLHQWLVENVPSYIVQDVPLFSATLNNQAFEQKQWQSYQLKTNDVLALTVEAKAPITILYAVIAVIAVGVAIQAMNAIPDNYNNTTPDGSSIYNANVQGNRPRLMGIIPELAGRHKTFPDHLTMPHRQYINNEQWIYLMLAVGVGEYQINADEIFIGNTPISNYTGDISYDIYSPGAVSNNNDAALNFYTSAEVGGTAGTSGFELSGLYVNTSSSADSIKLFFTGATFKGLKRMTYSYPGEADEYYYQTVALGYVSGDLLSIIGSVSNDGDYRVISVDSDVLTAQQIDANGADVVAWTEFVYERFSPATITALNVGGDGLFTGPFMACPENETTTKIELDFAFFQGLGNLNDNGEFDSHSVTIRVEYREESDANWSFIEYTFTNETNDQIAESKIITVAAGRYEVKVKRITEAYDDTRIHDKIEWTALRSELNTPVRYNDITTVAIKVRGTNALAGSSENKFNVIATRKLPAYENSVWTAPQATTDIAPFFAHVIKDVGHGDEQIGLTELERLHTIWQGRNDSFNAVFDNDSTLFNALKRVLATGFAEPTLDYGQIIPVRDEIRTGFDYMYQPENMKAPLKREIKLFDPDEPDGVEIEYFSNTTWKPETVMCLLGNELGIKPKKIRAFGITNETKAWQYGMRKRREMRYRRTKYSFTTEMDGLNSSYLSYDALADDIPGYSQTGQITGVKGRELTLSEPLEFSTGTHFISLRKPDGTLSGPYICTATDFENVVILTTDLDFSPNCSGRMELPLFQFGVADRWCLPSLITDIKPNGTDKVSVTAVNYDERVYADDDNLPAS